MTADPHPPDSYETVAEVAQDEVKIQRSRFIGLVAPADSDAAAKAFVQQTAATYHDARHVCYAWRLGYGQQIDEVRNDAGEPSGTAGEPILRALRQAELSDCVAVVVRYFGGIKLGTGGLARAYGQTAGAAVERAMRKTVLLGREFRLVFPYALQKTVTRLLDSQRGRVLDETYAADVAWLIWLPHSTWERFAATLTEATAGSVDLEPADR